jgi:hypothetical protein
LIGDGSCQESCHLFKNTLHECTLIYIIKIPVL